MSEHAPDKLATEQRLSEGCTTRPRFDRRSVLRHLGAASTVAGLAGLSGCVRTYRRYLGSPPEAVRPEADWPTSLYDERNTGVNPDAVGLRESVDDRWTFSTGWSITTEPIVVDGVVYVGGGVTGSGGELFAYDLESGDERTLFETEYYPPSNTPTVADGVIVAATRDDGLYGLDTSDESTRWHYPIADKIWSNPTAARGRVYLGDSGGAFHAVAVEDGSQQWTANHADDEIDTTAAVHEDLVLFGARDGRLYALDAATGDLWWKLSLGKSVQSPPTIVDGQLYVASYGDAYDEDERGYLHALDPGTGDEYWRFALDDVGGFWSPVVVGDIVGALSDRKVLYGVDVSTGDERWKREINLSTNVTAADDVLYCGGPAPGRDGRIYGLDARTGETLWTYETQSDVSTPVPIGDLLFTSSLDSSVRILSGDQ